MTDEKTRPASEEPASSNPHATPQAETEEQPALLADEATQLITPAGSKQTATEEIADQPTMLVSHVELSAESGASEHGEIADQPTMLVPRTETHTLADQSSPDAVTASSATPVPTQAAGEALPFIQAPQSTGTMPAQPAGDVYPFAQGSAPASGPLYAGQAAYPYPPVAGYTPNYAQPGYAQAAYQQSSSPLPLQPGQPVPYAPARKRRTWLWVVLIVLALFLLGGGTALAIVISQRPTNTPTQALQQFCDGYKTLNAQKIYDILSNSSRAKTSVAEMQRTFDEIKNFGDMVKITSCKVSNVQEHGSTATGTITLTDTASFGGISTTISLPISIGLVLENNTWKVDTTKTNSQFTFPTPSIQPNFLTPTVTGS